MGCMYAFSKMIPLLASSSMLGVMISLLCQETSWKPVKERKFGRASPVHCVNLPKSSDNMIMMFGGFEKVIGKDEIAVSNRMQGWVRMSRRLIQLMSK